VGQYKRVALDDPVETNSKPDLADQAKSREPDLADHQVKRHVHGARAPSNAAYGDKHASAAYLATSVWTFLDLVKAGLLPRGVALNPGGKLTWRFSDLDAAYEKARRSRKPKRAPRGVIKRRQEARE
jgi:hypothetical protein